MSELCELRGLDGRALLKMSEYSIKLAIVTDHARGALFSSHLAHLTKLAMTVIFSGQPIDALFSGSIWIGGQVVSTGPFHYLRGELSKPGIVPASLKDFWFVRVDEFDKGTPHQQLLGEFLEKLPT